MYRMDDARRINTNFNPFAKGYPDGGKYAYYSMTCDPRQAALICEAASFEEVDSLNDGDYPEGMVMEAVRVRSSSRTAQTMAALQRSLNKQMGDKGLTVGEAVIGKPKKSGLFATVTVQFPVSDGQTISIIFHSPDNDKGKVAPADEILAFRWLLNKRDITVAVSPEGEADVSLEEVGKRVAMLVERNMTTFATKQKDIVEQRAASAALQTQVTKAQEESAGALQSLTDQQAASVTLDGEIQAATEQLSKVVDFNADLQARVDAARAVAAGNEGKAVGEKAGYEASAAAYEAALQGLGFEADSNNPDSHSFNLFYVDENWGKAGAGSQSKERLSTLYAVEPSGTVADIVGGAGANKKFTAKSLATAKNAFDKASALVTELVGQVTTMGAWLNKYGAAVATVKMGDKFKVLRNRRRPDDGYYDIPGVVTSIGEPTDGNNPGLPAIRLTIGEATISAFAYNAWAEAIANGVVAPWEESSSAIDPTTPEGYAQGETVDIGAKGKALDQATYSALVDTFGWTAGRYPTKTIGGGFQGAVNPEGLRTVRAESKAGRLVAYHGENIVANVPMAISMSAEENAKALDDAVNAADPNYNGDPDLGRAEENAAVTILNAIIAGEYADSGSISNALDQAAEQLEGAGLMEMYDDRLNAAADYLTEVLKKEAA